MGCAIPNGNGTKTCNTLGNGFGSCSVAGCGIDFTLNNGLCSNVGIGQYSPDRNSAVFNCTNKPPQSRYTSSGNGSNSCLWACDTGYYRSGNVCRPVICQPGQDSVCAIPNGNGLKTCDSIGSSFGQCEIAGCGLDFFLNGGTCRGVGTGKYSPAEDKQVFNCSNKPLNSVYTTSGNGSNSCEWTCNGGFSRVGNTCVAHVCTPGSKKSCNVNNGSGEQLCLASGEGYANCVVQTCDVDHYWNGGTCVQVPVGFYSPAGSLQRTSCNNAPANTTYTSRGNGANQCTWGCNDGFNQVGNTCVAHVCTPGSTRSCSLENGQGQQACFNSGSGYANCVATSCIVDHFWNFGECREVEVGAYSPAGVIEQSFCNNRPANSAYTSRGNGTNNCSWECNDGFYQSGNSCIAQACSPGSTRSCSITNGTATQACNSNGSAFGSCSLTSCNANYFQTGNSCALQFRYVQSDERESYEDACARVGARTRTSGAICASGERKPAGVPLSWYEHGTWPNTAPTSPGTEFKRVGSKHYCYEADDKRDNDRTDKVVAWYCDFQ